MNAMRRLSVLTHGALLLLAVGCGNDRAQVLAPNARAGGAVVSPERGGRALDNATVAAPADCPDPAYLGPIIRLMGPGLDYTYPTGGYFLDESRMVPYDLPAGRRVTFSWSADASGACVDIHSSRWALDMEDVTDETPRIDEATDLEHWSVPSRTVTSATVGPFSIPLPPEPGSHLFFVEATDMNGFKSLGMIRINVTSAANRPPDCALAVAELLGSGPGNRSFARVAISGVTDPDGDPITITAMGVTQDEPLDGIGEPHTCPDASIERGTAWVRRERSGSGNGRVYTIAFTADDGQGGVCQGTVDVCIPHDRGARDCLKDALSVNSLGDCDRSLPSRSRATLEP